MPCVYKTLLLGLALLYGPASPLRAQEDMSSAEVQRVHALLEAVKQSHRPSSRMRVEWTYECNPSIAVVLADAAGPRPQGPIYTHKQCSLLVDGIRSRIDTLHNSYHSPADTTPYAVITTTAAYDGARQRTLETTKGEQGPEQKVGLQYPEDATGSEAANALHPAFNLITMSEDALWRDYNVTLSRIGADIYVISLAHRPGTEEADRITIDGGKGFNVVKLELLLPGGRRDCEYNITLKQYEGGIWFPAAVNKLRYDRDSNEPYVEAKTAITNVDTNPVIRANAFTLEFPHGLKVWDRALQQWYVVGGQMDDAIARFGRADKHASEAKATGTAPAGGGTPAATAAAAVADTAAQQHAAMGSLGMWLALIAIAAALAVVCVVIARRMNRSRAI